jgi:hypothetical protein
MLPEVNFKFLSLYRNAGTMGRACSMGAAVCPEKPVSVNVVRKIPLNTGAPVRI